MRRLASLLLTMLCVPLLTAGQVAAQQWVTTWTASVQGPYPTGNPMAQPELRYAFDPGDGRARPDVPVDREARRLGPQTRMRLSNAFGTKPVTFDGVFVGLQQSGAAVVRARIGPSCSAARRTSRSRPARNVVSDPVALPFVDTPASPLRTAASSPSASSRGRERPDDWHAKALQTS